MTDKKISELTEITGANTAADDYFVIVDTSEDETKKISREELNNAIERDDLSNVTITGGTIDGTVIGGTTPAAGTFTSGTFTGDVSFGDNNRAIFGAGSDLRIYHDGFHSYIYDTGAGDLRIRGVNLQLQSDAGENYLSASNNGAVTLYHDNAAKIATNAAGVSVTGNATFDDNGKAIFGADSDLQIYHDGSHSNITDAGTGNLRLQGNNLVLQNSDATKSYSVAVNGGAIDLRHNNSVKMATTSTGIEVSGSVVSQVGINEQTGTAYTTVLADQSKLVTLTNASAITLTIPANSSVAYPVGTKIDIAQLGAGQVTVVGAGGVTVNATPTLKLRDQYSGASCVKTATDTWLLVGDLSGA